MWVVSIPTVCPTWDVSSADPHDAFPRGSPSPPTRATCPTWDVSTADPCGVSSMGRLSPDPRNVSHVGQPSGCPAHRSGARGRALGGRTGPPVFHAVVLRVAPWWIPTTRRTCTSYADLHRLHGSGGSIRRMSGPVVGLSREGRAQVERSRAVPTPAPRTGRRGQLLDGPQAVPRGLTISLRASSSLAAPTPPASRASPSPRRPPWRTPSPSTTLPSCRPALHPRCPPRHGCGSGGAVHQAGGSPGGVGDAVPRSPGNPKGIPLWSGALGAEDGSSFAPDTEGSARATLLVAMDGRGRLGQAGARFLPGVAHLHASASSVRPRRLLRGSDLATRQPARRTAWPRVSRARRRRCPRRSALPWEGSSRGPSNADNSAARWYGGSTIRGSGVFDGDRDGPYSRVETGCLAHSRARCGSKIVPKPNIKHMLAPHELTHICSLSLISGHT